MLRGKIDAKEKRTPPNQKVRFFFKFFSVAYQSFQKVIIHQAAPTYFQLPSTENTVSNKYKVYEDV